MKRNIFLKQCLILIMILSLVGGGTIFAEEGDSNGNAVKMSFPDVPSGNWAEKHVSKLALLQITEGYPDGNFQPATEVIQQDVIKMIVSLMGYTEADLTTDIDDSHATHIANFIHEEVASYAQASVSFAFNEDILDYNMERDNIGSGTWGSKTATREWVAKVVIQSIGKK